MNTIPNWCYTRIAFYSTDETELKCFKNDIKTAIDTLPIIDRESKDWQGRVSRYLNSSAEGERGFIQSLSDIDLTEINGFTNYYFILDQEDAWGPHTDMWSELITELDKNISFVYTAEEPGCEVYVNTDFEGYFFPDRYTVDSDLESEYFTFIEDLLAYLEKLNDAFIGCETVRQAQYIAEHLVDNETFEWLTIAEFVDN